MVSTDRTRRGFWVGTVGAALVFGLAVGAGGGPDAHAVASLLWEVLGLTAGTLSQDQCGEALAVCQTELGAIARAATDATINPSPSAEQKQLEYLVGESRVLVSELHDLAAKNLEMQAQLVQLVADLATQGVSLSRTSEAMADQIAQLAGLADQLTTQQRDLTEQTRLLAEDRDRIDQQARLNAILAGISVIANALTVVYLIVLRPRKRRSRQPTP